MSDCVEDKSCSRGPAKSNLAAELSGAGTEVENIIGCGDGVGVVLDHQDRVAQIAQALEDFDEPVRVARMQADGRLVENVERADQMRAERRGELNALGLAAGERGGQAVERKIIEADFIEEAQPLADFFENPVGDGSLLGAELRARRRIGALRRR